MTKTLSTATLIAALAIPAAAFAFNGNEYATPAYQPSAAERSASASVDAATTHSPSATNEYGTPAFVATPVTLSATPLAMQVQRTLANAGLDRFDRVKVLADDNGRIFLTGLVPTHSQSAQIQALANGTAGVTGVVSDIQVQENN